MSRPDDTVAAPPRANGVIHDIGYQRYAGPRLGRRYVARSMYVHGLRTAYGFGRNARAKILPVGLFALSCVAAVILVVISTQLAKPLIDYVGIADTFSYVAIVFAAVVGPELVSRDLRNNLLPLYFSRPVTRTDYALTKLAALASAVFALLAAPMLIMFLGIAFSSPAGIGGLPGEAGKFLLGLLSAAIHAALFTAIAVPLAALTGRRVFATGLIIALFLLTEPISGVLGALGSGSTAELAGVFSPVSLLSGLDSWLFGERLTMTVDSYGPVYALVTAGVIVAGVGLSIVRYRKVRA
jgi:ABC-2 type transport system permease protein